ncbi:Elongator complex protein 1 like protein [Argiope bruennichi]|uniref:Elongator complex protein 1 n=1 Tax=Argiope bruennichi TaxID=94029 RepID=A0A8T0F794_ARGBR|nr:Elongator complex protein 1 like protein [Argiope bruennichi]
MKNLKLLNAQQTSTVPADNFCVDIDKKVYISSSKTLYYIEKSSPKAIPCADLISEIEDPKSYITGMEFLFESNSVFIAASSGDLYMYNIDDGEISAVGFVETSIEDFAWSPDQEFLVLLTGAGTLIMMTKEFDAFAEKSLCTDEFGESKPINVGWGSKTTQFHGSEGKEAARIKQKGQYIIPPPIICLIEPQQALPYDDLKSRISWRKDGEYFVTSSVDKSKGYRLLRVWNQAAVLQYTSEVVEGLEEPVCWRPLGNVIACSQQCPNKHQIIFFEKNGLRHGEFTLPFKPNTFKVSTLSWNSDSSILLVVAEEICDNPTDFQVMLWTSSNYHCFLNRVRTLFVGMTCNASGNIIAVLLDDGRVFPKKNSNKINIICDAVRNILDAKNDNKYYHTLLATYVKKEPSELDQALIRLKAFKDSNDLKSTRDAVDSALNFLLYLVNVHELRNTALGTYDLEIAIMVEQKSQKDPKEFLPFYNALQQMEENYRKFKVDMHLQRYKKALSHISKCDDKFSECLQLIKDHRLYTDALYIFPYYSEQFKAVWNEYGDYLMTKRYFDEAGLVFTRCGMHDKALLAYKDSLNWQKVLSSAIKLDYAENRIIDLCLEMSAKLKSSQRYLDASHLLEHYVKDPEEAIVTLVEGCEWNMAMLMISKYKRDDLAESHFIPTLREHGIYLLSHLSQLFETFSKYTERLKLVRTQKRIKAEEASTIKFEDDLFSDVGSVTDAASSCVESKQSGSIMTRKSSKSRRKQKIKKYRLKEGSADEDLALVAALSEIVTKVDTLKDNFLNTLKAMVHFDFDEGANLLQEKMTKIVSIIESEIPNIWNPLENNPAPEMKFGPDSTVNSITASLQMDKTTAPVVKGKKFKILKIASWLGFFLGIDWA